MIHAGLSLRRFADACWWLLKALSEDEILHALVNSARELSGADCVFLARRQGNELHIAASSGLHNPDMARAWRIPVGEGICGRVVAEGKAAVLVDWAKDPHGIEPVHSIVGAEGIRSGLALPVRRRSEVVGALCVTHRSLVHAEQWPKEALELLVRQAVSQLDLGTAVDLERLARATAESDAVEAQRSTDVVAALARVLATKKSLGRGLEILAEHLGATVVLVGRDGAVLERVAPRRASRAGDSMPRQSAAEPPPATLQAETDVDDGAGLLAQLQVLRALPLQPLERRALEQCAGVIALELLRERSAFETERRLGRQLLKELLRSESGDSDSLRYRASLLGVDLSTPRSVVQIGIHLGRGGRNKDLPPLQDADLWTIEGLARGVVSNAVGWISGSDVVLVLDTPDLSEGEARHLTSRLLKEASDQLRKPLCAGLGRPCTGIADYTVAAGEAQMALELGRVRIAPLEVVVRDQLGLCGLLGSAVDTREVIRMTERVLAPLLSADETSGSEYVHTLSVYHACDRHLAEAAQALHVHVNTLRYRLRKIEELLDGDLNDPNVRFMLELALRAHQTLRHEA